MVWWVLSIRIKEFVFYNKLRLSESSKTVCACLCACVYVSLCCVCVCVSEILFLGSSDQESCGYLRLHYESKQFVPACNSKHSSWWLSVFNSYCFSPLYTFTSLSDSKPYLLWRVKLSLQKSQWFSPVNPPEPEPLNSSLLFH